MTRSCKFTYTLEQCFTHVKPSNGKRPQRHFCTELVHKLGGGGSWHVSSSLRCYAVFIATRWGGVLAPFVRADDDFLWERQLKKWLEGVTL